MKVIAILPVRNEAWIMHHTLTILEHVCDEILIADGDSNDGTTEICASFRKVHLFSDIEKGPIKTKNRRKFLLDKVRDFDGFNFVLAIDADELLTGNIIDKEWENLLDSMNPGDAKHLRWYWMWKSPFHYRDDASVWSNRWMYCFFRDDRQTEYQSGNWHEARIPDKFIQQSSAVPNFGLMHFAQVGANRFLSRQAHCRVVELCEKSFTSASINQRYILTRDERKIRLNKIPNEWISPWERKELKFDQFFDPELNYFDVEILKYIHKFGAKHFANLDIWDVNWEFKRQLALTQKIEGLPEEEIEDPRNWEQRMYHGYLHRQMKNPLYREPQRPFIDGLKKLGLRRSHFERIGLSSKN